VHARLRLHRLAGVAACGLIVFGTAGCFGYPTRHEIQGDATAQIWISERSQVRLRNAQSRVFDETDKEEMLSAVVAVFQDLGFQIEVLDETLGIITGKKFLDAERPSSAAGLETYLIYDDESLVVFNRSYRTWGPFYRRSDLVRLTVTIRDRSAEQLIVRASAQHYLRPVESPRAYQQFYAALEQALVSERMMRTP